MDNFYTVQSQKVEYCFSSVANVCYRLAKPLDRAHPSYIDSLSVFVHRGILRGCSFSSLAFREIHVYASITTPPLRIRPGPGHHEPLNT